jgi:homoserine kinase
VSGEGEGELPGDAGNLVCRALAEGLDDLHGLEVECLNRIPLGRGLGSSAAATCAGLVIANALGGRRWSPDELLRRAALLEGHADNAAACLEGGIAVVAPGPRAVRVAVPDGLAFVSIVPVTRVSTDESRGALPERVPLADAAATLAACAGLVLALERGELDDIPPLLADRLHEPYRAPLVPGHAALSALRDEPGCLGLTVSGSGPSLLAWCRTPAATLVAARAREILAAQDRDSTVSVVRAAPTGVRARWGGPAGRLARAIG